MLVSLERDLCVLMAELATAPENRDKLTPGQSSVTPRDGRPASSRSSTTSPRASSRRPSSWCPARPVSPRYLDVGRTVVRRAERASLVAAPPPSLVVPYLNRLSDLLWTMARWQEGEALPARPSLIDP